MPPTAITTDEMVQNSYAFIDQCEEEEIIANFVNEPLEAAGHSYSFEYQDLTCCPFFNQAGNRMVIVENCDDGMLDETEKNVMGEQNTSKICTDNLLQLLQCCTEDGHSVQPIADQPTDTIMIEQQEEHQPIASNINSPITLPSHQESTVGSSSSNTTTTSSFRSVNGRTTYLLVNRKEDKKEEVSFKFKVFTKRSPDRRGTKLDTCPEPVGEVVVKFELPDGKKNVYINMRDPTLEDNNEPSKKKACVFDVLRTKFNLLSSQEVWIQVGDYEEKINVYCQKGKSKGEGEVFNVIDYNNNRLKCEDLTKRSRSSITPTDVVYTNHDITCQ